MFRAIRRLHQVAKTSASTEKQFVSTQATRMDFSQPFEEERLPWYNSDQFYPVRMGEIFHSKYKVVGKLGYGAHSTVWLCRNMKYVVLSDLASYIADFLNGDTGFVAIKVCNRQVAQSPRIHRELRFYEHVSTLNSEHYGQAYIRGLFETFTIDGPSGQHLCLVHPPMHMTIGELQRRNPSHRLNKQILKWTLFNLLSALSFLHDEAKVTHTDINPSNIMLTVADESILENFERGEIEEPSPMKAIDDVRTIYGSRSLGLPKDSLWGPPALCDFGEARIGGPHKGLIQPEMYRAPEVLFNMEWNTSVDTWNVAVLIWDLFLRTDIYFMPWTKTKSRQRLTMLLKWLDILVSLLLSIYNEVKSQGRFLMNKVAGRAQAG